MATTSVRCLLFAIFALVSSLATERRSGAQPYFYKGYDLSSLKIMEDGGATYKDTLRDNATMSVEDILEGMNTVRLRLWVHPKVPYDGGYYETYNLKYVMALAKRFHSKGYHIYLDYRESMRAILIKAMLNTGQISATVSSHTEASRWLTNNAL